MKEKTFTLEEIMTVIDEAIELSERTAISIRRNAIAAYTRGEIGSRDMADEMNRIRFEQESQFALTCLAMTFKGLAQ